MKAILHLLVVAAIATITRGDVSGTNPERNTCFCFNGYSVNIRSTACGGVIGSANSGQCFRYTGAKSSCSLSGRRYEFFQINWNGRYGWTAGVYLNRESGSRCEGSSGSAVSGGSGVSTGSGEYSCSISSSDLGRRIHEGSSSDDCRDCSGRNTCRGGQCVALVKCKCQRNGRYTPQTSCWRPGRRVINSDGRCNRAIPANTAIATFGSNNRYTQHAAVFIRCIDDRTFEVYDQWCAQSIGVRQKSDPSKMYATIVNSGCSEGYGRCQSEASGYTNCPSFRNQC